MYDNIKTYYKDANIFINEISAKTVIKLLRREEEQGTLTAEKCAYMSKAYIFIQDDKMAQKYARMAIRKNKNYPYGYIRLAFTYARLGKKRQTLKFTQIADKFDLSDNSFLLAFCATLYRYCEKQELAERLIKKLENFSVKGADYFYNMGFIYSQDEPKKAIEFFVKAEELEYKDRYNLWYNMAENYDLLEDYEKSSLYIDKCLKCGGSFKLFSLKAESLNRDEKYEEAVKYLRKQYKSIDNTDDKALVLAKIIYNYKMMNRAKYCSRYIDFALKNFEPTHTLYYVAANYYENECLYEKAIEMYKHMLETEDRDASVYTSISYCYSQIDNEELALEYADKALLLEPDNSYNYYRKGRVCANLKDYKSAVDSFMKSIEFDKTDVDSFQWISYCYSMTGEFEKSLEFANRALLLDKTDCYSYFRKAWAYQELGKYDEAIKYYKECIERNDKYVDAYLNISYIYSQLHDMKQSLLYANKALLINKDYAYAHYRKAWALQECGKLEEAFDGYSKAIELDPTDIYNYLGIACLSLNNNESSNALLYANKAIFIDRTCGGAYYYKSLALSNLGKQKEAEKAYAQAIKLGYTPA